MTLGVHIWHDDMLHRFSKKNINLGSAFAMNRSHCLVYCIVKRFVRKQSIVNMYVGIYQVATKDVSVNEWPSITVKVLIRIRTAFTFVTTTYGKFYRDIYNTFIFIFRKMQRYIYQQNSDQRCMIGLYINSSVVLTSPMISNYWNERITKILTLCWQSK